MMEASDANNLDRYKSYIQRRRVGYEQPHESLMSGMSALKTQEEDEGSAESKAISYRDFTSVDRSSGRLQAGNTEGDKIFGFAQNQNASNKESSVTALRKPDPGLYQRLYKQNRKISSFPYYRKSGNGYGASSHGAEIEDNRTTVLAIKVIKQALTCFAILGIIVLMQRRDETVNVLTFIKKHLVEAHIEPKNLLAGVENIVKECSRFLGGSP